MFFKSQARANARALTGVFALVATFCVAFSGAFFSGRMVYAAANEARVERFSQAAIRGFSSRDPDTSTLDAAVLSLAGRDDAPRLTLASNTDQVSQLAVLAARLERRAGARARPILTAVVAAAPYVYGDAVDASRDLDCLSQAVYYEARGESAAGQAAVAQVVLNRVRHPAYPKTVCGVVFQGAAGRGVCQFSFACDGSTRRAREPGAWSRAQQVAARALSGFVMAEVGTATNFHTTAVSPGWRGMLRVTQIGTHIFYRFGGSAGAASAFTAVPVPSRETAAVENTQVAEAPSAPAGPSASSAPSAVFYLVNAVTPAAERPSGSSENTTPSAAEAQAEPSTGL